MTSNFNCRVETEVLPKTKGSNLQFKTGNRLENGAV